MVGHVRGARGGRGGRDGDGTGPAARGGARVGRDGDGDGPARGGARRGRSRSRARARTRATTTRRVCAAPRDGRLGAVVLAVRLGAQPRAAHGERGAQEEVVRHDGRPDDPHGEQRRVGVRDEHRLRHEAREHVLGGRAHDRELRDEAHEDDDDEHADGRLDERAAPAREREQDEHVGRRDPHARRDGQVKEKLQCNCRANDLGNVRRGDGDLRGHPQQQRDGPREALARGAREVAPRHDAHARGEHLKKHRRERGGCNYAQVRVSELASSSDTRSPVARINVANRDEEGGAHKGAEAARWREGRRRRGGRRRRDGLGGGAGRGRVGLDERRRLDRVGAARVVGAGEGVVDAARDGRRHRRRDRDRLSRRGPRVRRHRRAPAPTLAVRLVRAREHRRRAPAVALAVRLVRALEELARAALGGRVRVRARVHRRGRVKKL